MATLNPKTSVLGYDNAYHLLRRTTYKISKARIVEFSTKTPQEAVALLFNFSEQFLIHEIFRNEKIL